MTEIRLRDAAGGDIGTVDADEVPDGDSILSVGGRYYARNQRNEGQWREVTLVKIKGDVTQAEQPKAVEQAKPADQPKTADTMPVVSTPKKADETV